MQKTKIEWCDYTRNPIKGMCKNDCWYCYAKAMYKRLKWDPTIREDWSIMNEIKTIKEPSKIFVGSMHDIFGPWVKDTTIRFIINYAYLYSQHTFIFLTKYPGRYKDFEFPKNCWLGTTITGEEENQSHIHGAFSGMDNIKFISYEPLLAKPEEITKYLSLDWIIVGGLTPKSRHKKEWVQNLIKQARERSIPIFIKDNLKWPEQIREYP